jgi:hypothetical protein
MGLMNKLRDKTHIILIVLFWLLGTIVFEWNGLSRDEGGQTMPIGLVNGEEITAQEYDDQIQYLTSNASKPRGSG